ncbi:MAG: hypothetical protein JWR16_587 [Nevskia sp.]|nr:hypothetical protein [Nevskia sp.]
MRKTSRLGLLWGVLVFAVCSGRASALDFEIPTFGFGDQPISAVLNTTLTAGGGFRTQGQSVNLIGKSNLNPGVCGGPNGAYQSCQGLFRDQSYPAAQLAAAPGAASVNGDDGDLNYGKGSLFQAVVKVTSDLTLTYGNFGIFARSLYFYDFVNNDKIERHPNLITPDNYLQVGRHVPGLAGGLLGGLSPGQIVSCLTNPGANLLCPASGVLQAALVDNRSYGRPDGNGNFVVYGPGGHVRQRRTDGEVLRQSGTNLQYLDTYLYGKLPIPFWTDKEVSFKVGRQLVNWGESTTIVLNSVNQANPVNANNFYRIGSQVEEDFTPINMVNVSFDPFENATVEAFYQLEWQPVEAPAPGTYFSDIDVGTNDAGKALNVNAGFGGAAEDPHGLGTPQDNPLAGITPTSTMITRLSDREPRTSGQFGVKLGYYADWLNGGTDMSVYYMNYHSRLPLASFYSTYPSCARREGNGRGNDATNTLGFFLDCPNIPLVKGLLGSNALTGPGTSSALELDSARFQLEYPEDIHLIGASFNTTVGEYSIQGEVAYRPNEPLQVDAQDLAFAAFGPTLSRCSEPGANCLGTIGGVGYSQTGGTQLYSSSNFKPKSGQTAYPDTFDLIIGALPGSARSFPNFVIPYRGGTIGENAPCYPKPGTAEDVSAGLSGVSHPYYAYNPSSPCYIRGYQRMQVFQFNLGATRVLGATDNPLGASQVLLLFEVGATYVPFLPPLDKLVLEGPNTNYGATAGADGSGANGSRMACSTTPDCSLGADGLRFNPHQQDPTGYPDMFSWGYRLISIIKYESVLPGLSISPFIVYKQDVQGTAPSPAPNFVAGRKEVDILTEFRYKGSMSLNLGYTWYWGGGTFNTLSDRDFAQAFIKYQF